LKFGIFVHPKRPKIPVNEIVRVIQSNGVSYSNKDPEVAVVVSMLYNFTTSNQE